MFWHKRITWNPTSTPWREFHLRGKAAQFVPIRFIYRNKLTRNDRLLVAFDTLALSKVVGREIGIAKIIHGDDRAVADVNTSSLWGQVQDVQRKLITLVSASSPPDLILIRHCTECEFQAQCRQRALEKDELSLLGGIKEGDRKKLHSKGIFTLNQLSYTFRPRRRPKKSTSLAPQHYFPLQALAIRNNTVYLNGKPDLPCAETSVFLDVEGLSSAGPFYLVGALVLKSGQEEFHSFWADRPSEQANIFAQFIELVLSQSQPPFRIFHFGRYDTAALKIMRNRLPQELQPKLDLIMERTTNVLSIVYSHVYFPTYSNGLKDLGRFLGCQWTTECSSGLSSIVARKSWEADQNAATKAALIQYNKEDCMALKRLYEFIVALMNPLTAHKLPAECARVEEIKQDTAEHRPSFAQKTFALEDLLYVTKCAYFDYQRDKVVFRTQPHLRHRKSASGGIDPSTLRPNTTIIVEKQQCPTCQSKRLREKHLTDYFVLDLKFAKTGVRRFVTKFSARNYLCLKCKYPFSARGGRGNRIKFGRSLLVWCAYCNVLCCQSLGQIGRTAQDLFQIRLQPPEVSRARRELAEEYKAVYDDILSSMLRGPLVQADETTVHLVKEHGYVWVLASVDRCYLFYRPNREGAFLLDMLKPFTGVLVSDFYSAYDSLPCPQQKCLVHFVRDIDDDLLKNPLDQELKSLAQDFGTLLKDIMRTVDRYGLTRYHLHKHAAIATRFLSSTASRAFSSELAKSYQERFRKSGHKMFTFLDYDGIPWNNNNAEHVIKKFAKYRKAFDGYFTQHSLQDYLVLASVFATCELNNVNVLRFLLSGEKTLEGLLSMSGRRTTMAVNPAAPLLPSIDNH